MARDVRAVLSMAVVTVVVSWEAAAKVGVSTVAVARAVAWREVVVWAVG